MSKISYIFGEGAEEIFEKKLRVFHSDFVIRNLLCGVAELGAKIDEIKFTRNRNFVDKYFERIVGGFQNVPTDISIISTRDRALNTECLYTFLNYDEYINNVFMVQNVMNWSSPNNFCCTVWELKKTSLLEIGKYWR